MYPAIRKTPIFLLLFFQAQLMPGLAVTSDRTSHPNPANRALASQSPTLPVAEKNQASEAICPAQLGTAIEAVINRPQFRRARWGILIEPLQAKSRILYSYNSDRYFIPASNTKLLTTAAALQALGSEFRIRTSVYDTGGGTLRVVGRGDPSLTDTQLRDLAQQLKRRGVRNVKRLIVDNSYFQGDAINPNWEWEDVQADYGTSVNSLILNQNAVQLTLSPQKVGQPLSVSWSDAIAAKQWKIENESMTAVAGTPDSLTLTGALGQPVLRIKGQVGVNSEPIPLDLAILDPAQNFLEHFGRILAQEGIKVERASVESKISKVGEQELAAVQSPPLSVLLTETNQNSNNLYAEALLRTLQVADKTSPSSNSNSIDRGLKQLKTTLTALGVNPESYVLSDGSGLSRHNLVSPEAIAQTLQFMAQSPQARVYRASLPVAGVSGSLKNRFLNTAAQGNLQAKTGTVSGVSALSGYLEMPGYRPLVFSIIVNQSDQSSTTLRQAIDEIVLLLTRLRSC